MQVEIYLDGKLIGRSNLDAADPAMRVAAGPFEPGPDYERDVHAGEIDGDHNPVGADLPYIVQSRAHGALDGAGVFIKDYSDSLGERHVDVLGIPGYDTYFGDDPAFKAWKSRVRFRPIADIPTRRKSASHQTSSLVYFLTRGVRVTTKEYRVIPIAPGTRAA